MVPHAFRDLLVDGAEGNPFYVEELVRMLIDDRVIERWAGAWSVDLERLKRARVPPTLTGVLQARLDGLPKPERDVLQRAAVVGRLFWDAAVADLTDLERGEVAALLEAARGRELVYRRERSAFAGAEEFLFKHALLRDAAYETVLLRLRKDYHARVAHWLEAHAGERLNEYSGLIAEHLALAGRAEDAVGYLRRSAEKALDAGAYRDALQIAERALGFLPRRRSRTDGSRSAARPGALFHGRVCRGPRAARNRAGSGTGRRRAGTLRHRVELPWHDRH